MWVALAPPERLVVFDYNKHRDKNAAIKLLDNFKVFLQTDLYVAYEQFATNPDIVQLNCMAQVRRKFCVA